MGKILTLNLKSFSPEGPLQGFTPSPHPHSSRGASLQGFQEFFEESLPICLCTLAPEAQAAGRPPASPGVPVQAPCWAGIPLHSTAV